MLGASGSDMTARWATQYAPQPSPARRGRTAPRLRDGGVPQQGDRRGTLLQTINSPVCLVQASAKSRRRRGRQRRRRLARGPRRRPAGWRRALGSSASAGSGTLASVRSVTGARAARRPRGWWARGRSLAAPVAPEAKLELGRRRRERPAPMRRERPCVPGVGSPARTLGPPRAGRFNRLPQHVGQVLDEPELRAQPRRVRREPGRAGRSGTPGRARPWSPPSTRGSSLRRACLRRSRAPGRDQTTRATCPTVLPSASRARPGRDCGREGEAERQ